MKETILHPTPAHVDFGSSLAAERERRGLSRSDVARSTKLPPVLVGALEDGETAKWPERPFLVNALRAYASAVGLDPTETIARLDRIAPEAPDGFDPPALERARRDRALTMVLGLVVAISLGLLGSVLHSAWFFATRAAR